MIIPIKQIILEGGYMNLFLENSSLSFIPTKEEKYEDLKKIHLQSYKVPIDDKDIDEWVENKDNFVFKYDNKKMTGFLRYKILPKSNKYGRFSKTNHFIFISDLASTKKGGGGLLLNYINNEANKKKMDQILIPWTKDLIKYYDKFDFIEKDTKKLKHYPSRLMAKHYTNSKLNKINLGNKTILIKDL